MEIKTVVRKWGNSFGVILPKEFVSISHIEENDEIIITVKKRHLAKEFFGILSNWNKPTIEIKKDMKKGW